MLLSHYLFLIVIPASPRPLPPLLLLHCLTAAAVEGVVEGGNVRAAGKKRRKGARDLRPFSSFLSCSQEQGARASQQTEAAVELRQLYVSNVASNATLEAPLASNVQLEALL